MTRGVDPAVVAEAGRVYGEVYDVAAAAVRREQLSRSVDGNVTDPAMIGPALPTAEGSGRQDAAS